MTTAAHDWATSLTDEMDSLQLTLDAKIAAEHKRCEIFWTDVFSRFSELTLAARGMLGGYGMQVTANRSVESYPKPWIDVQIYLPAGGRSAMTIVRVSINTEGSMICNGVGTSLLKPDLNDFNIEAIDDFLMALIVAFRRKHLGLS